MCVLNHLYLDKKGMFASNVLRPSLALYFATSKLTAEGIFLIFYFFFKISLFIIYLSI